MKTKSEIRISEARKKTESRKQKSALFSVAQTLQGESAEAENFGVQSSDFFRTSDFGLRISSDSPSLKQFNSEF
jgi:hypothetical protein